MHSLQDELANCLHFQSSLIQLLKSVRAMEEAATSPTRQIPVATSQELAASPATEAPRDY